MKKIFILLVSFAVIIVICIYIFIPSKIHIASAATGKTNPKAAYRFLLNDANWKKWWPGEKSFTSNGFEFQLTKKMFNLFELQLSDKEDLLKTILQLIPSDKDSTGYLWSCEMNSGQNPITRLSRYLKARQIKKTLNLLIESLNKNLSKEEVVYGFKVKAVKVSDSVLISTRCVFNHYPGENEIDSLIQQLRKYIASQNSMEKNYPMLNVRLNGTNEYEAMVAIATEKLLPATTTFSPKLVLKGGNILEAEFKGGPAATKKAFEEFENYRSDYRIQAPAIPYQLLITDRVKEADTTKWVTKFYYPIF